MWNYHLRHISAHIQIEESFLFPKMQKLYPEIDSSWLFEDHKHLTALESKVTRALKETNPENSLALVEIVLDYDRSLMTHLGEEEEWVVPLMTLPEQDHF